MPNPLRIGIVGAGFYAAIHLIPHLRATGRAEVIAVVRRNPERLALFQKELGVPEIYTDWREMLDKSRLDAVAVSTPHNQHVAPVVAALQRGLHAFVEKPIADTVEGALRIAEAAERSGRVVTVGVNTRGIPIWRAVHAAVKSGAIGRVRQINLVSAIDSRLLRQQVQLAGWVRQLRESSDLMRDLADDLFTPTHWRRDASRMGGDSVMDVGAHAVDAMLWLANGKPVEVVAFTPRGDGSTTVIAAQARLDNDVLLSITFNDCVNEGDAEWGAYGNARTTVIGDNGLAVVDSTSLGVQNVKEAWLERNGERQPVTASDEGISPVAAFVATVLDGAPNLCTAEEGAQTVALIQSVYRSADEGRIVTL